MKHEVATPRFGAPPGGAWRSAFRFLSRRKVTGMDARFRDLITPGSEGRPMFLEATIDELETLVSSQTANPLEVIEWYRRRIDFDAAQRNSLKAYVSVCDDRPTPDENPSRGELFGIPVVVKDNMEVAGLPMTCGSIALRDYIPAQDCEVVQRLRSAGAFILGKGSMSEFAWGITDTLGSAVGGFTRNPYDTNYACGGSSGGSAVAVSANLAAAGLGTDTGCSIRAPASMTGLVGVRPTFGRRTGRGSISDHGIAFTATMSMSIWARLDPEIWTTP